MRYNNRRNMVNKKIIGKEMKKGRDALLVSKNGF